MNFRNRLLNALRGVVHRAEGNAEERRLAELRRRNPTCAIHTARLADVTVGNYVALHAGAVLRSVTIADHSYVSGDTEIDNAVIGRFCSIGPNVRIGLAPHPVSRFVSTYPAFFSDANSGCLESFRTDKIFDDGIPVTTIANDVWIGAQALIPGGILINSGAVIAAGSVVVKDVPPYAIVGGNPARLIRMRFSDEQIALLLAAEWWNWPLSRIREHADSFADVDAFASLVRELKLDLRPAAG